LKSSGVFLQNYQGLRIFGINELFSEGKGVNWLYAAVNQVHGPGSHSPSASLNRGHLLLDGRLGFNQSEGGMQLLILDLDL
jgi:hypothetical protein